MVLFWSPHPLGDWHIIERSFTYSDNPEACTIFVLALPLILVQHMSFRQLPELGLYMYVSWSGSHLRMCESKHSIYSTVCNLHSLSLKIGNIINEFSLRRRCKRGYSLQSLQSFCHTSIVFWLKSLV